MISILSLLALGLVAEPSSKEAVCSVNDGAPIPCVVVYDTDESIGAAGLGFVFNANTSVVFIGEKQGTQINVVLASVSEGQPFEVESGVCIAQEGAVGCQATAGGETLKVVAAFK